MAEKVVNRNEYKNDWQRENRDRYSLMFPKTSEDGTPTKAEVKAAADATKGGNMSAWILEAIREKLDREGR